jgi:hypothetical protein
MYAHVNKKRKEKKRGTFGLCCSIPEQSKHYSCQLKRQIPICINICDINLFTDFEISHSKQIKLIKTSEISGNCTLTPHCLNEDVENWKTPQILKSHPESGREKGKARANCTCQVRG